MAAEGMRHACSHACSLLRSRTLHLNLRAPCTEVIVDAVECPDGGIGWHRDIADGVREVIKRPYIDGDRVGIIGHSYGGFMAAMGICKFPGVYAAASIGAGVTDWRNYDTIYTERYMSTPQLNPKGYDTGSVMTYAKQLKGKAHILHGMVDDNVHPNNAFQLIAVLDKEGIPYESRFWPNGGHGLGRGAAKAKWEFLDRWLRPGE